MFSAQPLCAWWEDACLRVRAATWTISKVNKRQVTLNQSENVTYAVDDQSPKENPESWQSPLKHGGSSKLLMGCSTVKQMRCWNVYGKADNRDLMFDNPHSLFDSSWLDWAFARWADGSVEGLLPVGPTSTDPLIRYHYQHCIAPEQRALPYLGCVLAHFGELSLVWKKWKKVEL